MSIRNKLKNNSYLFSVGLWGQSLIDPVQKNSQLKLHELFSKGVMAVPDFFSENDCDQFRQAFDRLEADHSKSFGSDRRIFGIEALSEFHAKRFAERADLLALGESYLGLPMHLHNTLGGKLYADPEGLGSGGGWHRDSFFPQFKVIVYLTDVTMENGPFEYVVGSHRVQRKCSDVLRQKSGISPRYTQASVDSMCSKDGQSVKSFVGKAGTAILCDTSGVHRGRPIREGVRYAITNYYHSRSRWVQRNGSDMIDQLVSENKI